MTAQLTQEQLKELLADQTIQIRALELKVQELQKQVEQLSDENIKLSEDQDGE